MDELQVGIGVLGTAYVEVDGLPRTLGAAKQRALLSLLAMHANERVTTDTIVDVLWPDVPPAAAVATVRGYVVDLRRVVEPHRVRHGASRDRLDLLGDAWRPLVADTDRTRAGELAASLELALGQWRGEPLADLGQHPDVQAERDRLRSLRLEAQVMRLGALVGLRRHAGAVTELERLCRAHPWHEHLWALRSLALAGCGRQVEALAHLRALRAALADQLGIDPDPQVARLETDLIRQDLPGHSSAPPAAHRRLITATAARTSAPRRLCRGFTG
jgi:DNA-binding SARP family transcriptional activator